jgi:hypothetical protein
MYLQTGLLYICVQIFALYVAPVCNKPRLPSFLFTYSLSMSAFSSCRLYIACIFLVFLLTLCISSHLKLTKPAVYLNTRTANAPVAVMLFLACNSDVSIALNLAMHSSVGIKHLHFPQSLATCTFFLFLTQTVVFLC